MTVGSKVLLHGQIATVIAISKFGRRNVLLARIDATGVEAWYYYNQAYLTAV